MVLRAGSYKTFAISANSRATSSAKACCYATRDIALAAQFVSMLEYGAQGKMEVMARFFYVLKSDTTWSMNALRIYTNNMNIPIPIIVLIILLSVIGLAHLLLQYLSIKEELRVREVEE